MRHPFLEANRRQALRALAGYLAGSPLLKAERDPEHGRSRVAAFGELATTYDFEAVAFERLPRPAYDYQASYTDSGYTKRRNRDAFGWVDLVPGKSTEARLVQTATKILGTEMAFPLMVSPTAGHGQFHPDGEMATHQGAAGASATPMLVSNNSSFTIDKIGAAAASPFWFQLYPKLELDANRRLLDDAQKAGCRAVVVTVDQQAQYSELLDRNQSLSGVVARRARRQTFTNPYRVDDSRLWYEWSFFEKIRPFVKVPIVAKGILTAEDAALCVEHGLDAVYVSNHGGRALDYSPSSLEVLPEIADAVRGRVPVLFDSGIRRGTDILKALALGASAVCVGRVPLWGLGAYGPAGVQRVLEILQAELVKAMTDAGRPTLASIDRSLVRTNFQ
jgi:isopentenyl diphosphate isomerase/L-lactate dehydrogenase-like FMN-dependent dehydrogenase